MAGGEDRPVMRAQGGLLGKEEKDRLSVRYEIVGGSVGEHALASYGIPPNQKSPFCTWILCTMEHTLTSDFLDSVS